MATSTLMAGMARITTGNTRLVLAVELDDLTRKDTSLMQ
jgi:hypothetical protein